MTTLSAEIASHARRGRASVGEGRQAWIDVARAVAIVLVVVGHTERGLVAAGMMQGAKVEAFDHVIYSFHVPLFFLISGLLFAQSIRRQPFRRSWKARTVRLVQPCLIWSAILLALIVLAAGSANSPVSLGQALAGLLLLPLQPVSIFWFLYTLLICMVVSALLTEYWKWSPARLLFWSAIIHAVYLLWFTDVETTIGLQFIRFAEHQLYFAIGFFLSHTLLGDTSFLRRAQTSKAGVALFAAVSAACFAVAATMLIRGNFAYQSPIGTVAALSGDATILAACYFTVELMKWRPPGFLLMISAETLAIFCMHVPFVSGARIALADIGTHNPLLFLAASAIIGIAGPLMALRVIDSLGLAGLAGFANERRIWRYAERQ
jgi:fucose 4-O-acetylase-like acetyltransferase